VGVAVRVFGHRGACGYLPENTLESFEHAFELGAEAIEFDVVMTRDGVPVIRHDRDLTHTTDIQKHSFLSTMVDELTAEDVAQLRAIERYPEGRSDSASHDGRYRIPTLSEVVNHPGFDGRHLIIELKYGKHFHDAGLDSVQALKTVLDHARLGERDIKVTIECFEFAVLRRAKEAIGRIADYVFLSAPDMLPQGYSELEDDLLDEIADNFEGLSVAIPMVLQGDLVARAKAKGLYIFTYTARVETAEGDWRVWFERLVSTGVDGIFADQPDLLAEVVAALP
jgi:glycerophosphoryl diester phosphodiesterase